MPTKRIGFADFNRRLILAGGREQTGPNGLRRASGVAPETTTSVISRWGSTLLYNINAIQCFYYNGTRYQYDGNNLYANGVSIQSGFNGGRLRFNTMPPQAGLADYLFILGGGVAPFKIAPSGAISNWGILNPPNGMTGALVAQDQIVIDTFVNHAANWSHTNASLTDVSATSDGTETPVNAGCLKINPSAAWNIVNDFSDTPQNWLYYSNNDFVLDTDVFQVWFYFDSFGGSATGNSTLASWFEIDIDVNDGTFKKDWYSSAVGVVPAGVANPRVRHIVNYNIEFSTGQWQQLTIPRSQFLRNGVDFQFDWTCVQAIRIKGGNFTGNLYLDNLTLAGGDGKGAGPTVGQGGVEYDYSVVYRNLTTGSQSNGNDDPLPVFGVQVQKVMLANIPVSADSQVGARDIYRTQALTQPGGGSSFYVDTIYDNSTTTYIDKYSDFSLRLVTTPWQESTVMPPATQAAGASTFVDSGTGYYFKLTTPGTTGAQPPAWTVPTSIWKANEAFVEGETVAPLQGGGNFFQVTTAGISGVFTPHWAAATGLGNTVQDGAVVWTNIGSKTVTDNTAVWTFQGINSTPVLSNTEQLYDNAPPLSSYGDAWGPYQDSMFWTKDSATGTAGYLYASPPGRPESVGQFYTLGSATDPCQKVVSWDDVLWVLTTAHLYQVNGSYPQFSPLSVDDALGTTSPDTVVPLQAIGVIYWAPDGIRTANFAGSRLLAFQALAPIFRGQPEENVAAWSPTNPPVWAEHFRDEVVFSNGTTLTLALAYDGVEGAPVWRLPGPVLTAAYYEHQTGQIQAAFGGNVYLYENPGEISDGGSSISFELQSPGDVPDLGIQFTTQRIYVSANLNGQVLTPTAIIDGTETTLPDITGVSRQTFELSPKLCGRLFDGVRLVGNLTNRVEIFRIEADVWLG